MDDYFRQYGLLAIFIVIAVGIPVGMLAISFLGSLVRIRPKHSSVVKRSSYESGLAPFSPKPKLFRFQYYYYAILFVTFDVETILLYPVAASYGVVSAQFGIGALIAVLVFLLVVTLPFVQAWRKKALDWK